jgi:hypothetical protein
VLLRNSDQRDVLVGVLISRFSMPRVPLRHPLRAERTKSEFAQHTWRRTLRRCYVAPQTSATASLPDRATPKKTCKIMSLLSTPVPEPVPEHMMEARRMRAHMKRMGGTARTTARFVENVRTSCTERTCEWTSHSIVDSAARDLMVLINTESDAKSAGLIVGGRLMPVIVFADVMGEQVLFTSDHVTIVHDMCGSSHGCSADDYGPSVALRRGIDTLKAQATALNASICMVYSAPWGSDVRHCAWRLMTVRLHNGQFFDSERYITSFTAPMPRPGRSVIDAHTVNVPSTSVRYLQVNLRARNVDQACDDIDDADDTEPSCPSTNHDHRVNVLKGIVKALRLENTTLQQTLVGERHTAKANTEIVATQRMAKEREGYEKMKWSFERLLEDNTRVHGRLTIELRSVRRQRDQCTKRSIFHALRVQCEVRAQKAALLVEREQQQKSTRADEARRNDARKRDVEERKVRQRMEAKAEESQRELQRVGEELERYKRRAADAKTEASSSMAKLVDANNAARNELGDARERLDYTLRQHAVHSEQTKAKIASLEESRRDMRRREEAAVAEGARSMLQINELKDASRTQTHVARANELKSARAVARAMGRAHTFRACHTASVVRAFVLALRLRRATAAAASDRGASPTAATVVSPTYTPETSPELTGDALWNVVASAKRAMATLEHFVSTAQTGGGSGGETKTSAMVVAPHLDAGANTGKTLVYGQDYYAQPFYNSSAHPQQQQFFAHPPPFAHAVPYQIMAQPTAHAVAPPLPSGRGPRVPSRQHMRAR